MYPPNETLGNEDNSSTIGEVEAMSPMMIAIFCLYTIVFTLAFVGNIFTLITCYKIYKVTTKYLTVLLCYVASLASADLMFTLLSIFDLIALAPFIGNGDWFGGNPVCKIQRFLIESCYTVSILTLVAIGYERLKATPSPVFRAQRTTKRTLIPKVLQHFTCCTNKRTNIPKIIWVIGFAFCGPLLYAYYVKKEETSGKLICVNEYMGDLGRQIYYIIQTGLLFLALEIIRRAYVKILNRFLSRPRPSYRCRCMIEHDRQKQRKITKMMAIVTLLFFICYGPFMVIRVLRYFHIYNGDMMWRLGQMMIFGQTAVKPIIYYLYSEHFRFFFKDLIRCRIRTRENIFDRVNCTLEFIFGIWEGSRLNKIYSMRVIHEDESHL